MLLRKAGSGDFVKESERSLIARYTITNERCGAYCDPLVYQLDRRQRVVMTGVYWKKGNYIKLERIGI